MTKYVIEKEGRLWVLRRLGRRETIASGSDLLSFCEEAFVRQRRYAPCSLRTVSEVSEEWQLESSDGEWSRVLTLASGDRTD